MSLAGGGVAGGAAAAVAAAGGCMQRRNRYMVEHASLPIAVHDGLPGGTRRTIEYALRRGIGIVDIPVG